MIRTSIRFNHKHIILLRNHYIRTKAHVIILNATIGRFAAYGLSSSGSTVVLVWVFSPRILGWCFVGQAAHGRNTWYTIRIGGDDLTFVKVSRYQGECRSDSTILDKFVGCRVCVTYQLEDNTMTAIFSWKLRHDTVSRFNAEIKEEALSRVHTRGVESIAPVRSAAGWTTGSFAVVDAKIVIQPTRHLGGVNSDSGGCKCNAEEDGDLVGVQHHKEI
jgi:hypothetical protein